MTAIGLVFQVREFLTGIKTSACYRAMLKESFAPVLCELAGAVPGLPFSSK